MIAWCHTLWALYLILAIFLDIAGGDKIVVWGFILTSSVWQAAAMVLIGLKNQ